MTPKSKRAMDPTLRPPPGYALTQPRKKWAWERPAKYADPNEAVSAVIDSLEKPEVETRYLKLMMAGFTIEEITNSIAIGGFQQGMVSPDVAELIKGPVATYLMGLATDYNIDVKPFSTPDGGPPIDDGPDDISLLKIMQKRNPQMFRRVMQTNQELETMATEMREREKAIEADSFLAVEPKEIDESSEGGEA